MKSLYSRIILIKKRNNELINRNEYVFFGKDFSTKNIVTLIIVFTTLILNAQNNKTEIVKLKDGTKIEINLLDKTWKYYNEEITKSNNQDTISSKFLFKGSSIDWIRTLKYPVWNGPELDYDFSKYNDIEFIGYVNGYFKIKTNDGKVGYVDKYCTNFSYFKKDSLIKELQQRDIKIAKDKGQMILINGILVYGINSADGVKFRIECGYFDKSKDIKYLYFTVLPYNSVGDVQSCDIGGHSYFEGKVTGPISASDEINEYYWDCAWYNNTISCLKITKVKVVYMDGSSYTFANELSKVMNLEYQCRCN
jgi:hypothetical protein